MSQALSAPPPRSAPKTDNYPPAEEAPPPPLTATKSLNSHPSESAPTPGPILHKCR